MDKSPKALMEFPYSPRFKNSDFSVCKSVQLLWRLALPNIFRMVLYGIIDGVSYSYLGRIPNPDYVAGVGIGCSFASICLLTPLSAFGHGLETLISQSFGKREYSLCNVYYWKVVFLLVMMLFLLCPVLYFSEHIFLLYITDPLMARVAGTFCANYIPYCFVSMINETLYVFLNAQQIMTAPTICSTLALIMEPFWTILFMDYFNMGYLGACYTYNLTACIEFILLVNYIYLSGDCSQTLQWPTVAVFKNLKAVFSICFSSALMTTLENYSYSFLNLFCSAFDSNIVACNQILIKLDSDLYNISSGLGTAASTLVGNALGENKIALAKFYAKIAFMSNLIVLLTFFGLIYHFRVLIANILTAETNVSILVVWYLPYILAIIMAESQLCILSSILYGLGKQNVGSYFNMVIFVMLLLPLGLILAFVAKLEILGMWIAIAIAYYLNNTLYGLYIILSNWNTSAKDVQERFEKDRISDHASFI